MQQQPFTRRWAALAAVTLSFVAAGSAMAQAAKVKMPSAAGQIMYRMNGPAFNGTTTLTWAENGKKARNDFKMTAAQPGQHMAMEGWTITDGSHVYVHNALLGKQVMRMKMDGKDPSDLLSIGGTGVGGKGKEGKVVGKATILGKPCEVRQMEGTKIWLWQGLPLKVETAAQGQQMTIQATKIDTNFKPAAALFKVPAGMQVMDAPQGFPGVPGGPGAPGGPRR